MAFSPTQAPVYGGGTVTVVFPERTDGLTEESILFWVFEGAQQRHIAVGYVTDPCTVQSVIPAHNEAESAKLRLILCHGGGHETLATCAFHYHHDSAFHMAQYLLNSVYSHGALDDLELIQSDYFDLSNEILSTLDDRLSQALISITLPDWWNILGSDSFDEPLQPRETLFHFTAHLGLTQVATVFLGKPGSEEALQLPNHHGYLPREIALQNSFDGLAELLSKYNARIAKLDYQKIETNRGVIVERGGEAISLTTWSSFNTSLEDDVIMLQKIRTKMEELPSPSYLRQFQSHWPGNSPDNNNTGEKKKIEEVEGPTVDAIYQKSKEIQNQIKVLVEAADDDPRQSSLEDLSDAASLSDTNAKTDLTDDVVVTQLETHAFDGSISSLREFNEHLSQLRSQQSTASLTVQDIRKENLSRFSSSCPSLDTDIGGSHLTAIDDTDRHRSMHDLLDEVEPTPHPADDSYITSHSARPHYGDGIDSNVSICVNGVAVNSTGEILDSSLNRFLSKYYGGNFAGVRRRSWCAEIVNDTDTDQSQRRALKATMLAITGKSVSLPSLDGNGESDDEESFHDARENPTPSQSQTSLGSPLEDNRCSEMQLDHSEAGRIISHSSLSYKPTDAKGGGGYKDMKPSSSGTARKLARSKGDIDLGILGEGEEVHIFESNTSGNLTKAQSSDAADDSVNLSVPHSIMTKSLSTPSIPAATNAAINSGKDKRGQKDPKQASSSFLLIKKLLEEHDAQIRRQEEVEEEEDESSHRHHQRSEVTLYDFLNEQSRIVRTDSNKVTKKEEKKKKTGGVFSRFQSSYRIKKNKDKENKNKTTHQFLAISFSNNTVCDVCRKLLANKLALHCKNCLVNVHENSCKDQVTPCSKFKHDKGPLPRGEGSSPTQNLSLRDKQTQSATLPAVSGLRPSLSFKEKRSSSAPVRPQVTPPTGVVSPHQAFLQSQTASLTAHRHSLPSANNVISEENESDLLSPEPELNASNITEAISESIESLDDTDGVSAEVNQFDEELTMLRTEEPEAWNLTVDKKTLKKMGAKDVKRQDHIWELIQTERHHCRVLKIIQNIYSKGILEELQMPPDIVERLFPKLDDLIEVHMTFLYTLQDLQKRRPDRSIEEIGATLYNQFSGNKVEKMKMAYGAFCSGHKEAVQFYKDYLNRDRKFQTFIKKCNNYSLCKKREIPDFILSVTTRPTKYPTLIEAILKSTKDKKDRENLSHTLQLSKDLLRSIDEQVDAHERRVRLEEIYTRMDSKSTTWLRTKKFKRSDLLSMGRKLLFEGNIWWKNARGKVSEVIAVILTDLILFIQESNQKYVFVSQDNKPGVIPLFKLLVREKGDTRDSKGIYLISQNRHQPEMYELVCKSSEERATWISVLRTAVEKCPDVEEEAPSENEEEKQRFEARAARVKELIELLHMKDLEIKQCCDEKNKLMVELVEVYTSNNEAQAKRPGSGSSSRPGSRGDDDAPDHVYALQVAIQEVSATASRLTGLLQSNNGTQLQRHVSSVGEHISASYSLPFIPKRAETFAGFDSTSYEPPKPSTSQKKLLPQQGYEGSPNSSVQSLHRIDSDTELDISQLSQDQSYNKSDREESDHSQVVEKPCDGESVGDISGSSTSSLNPPSADYLISIAQLNKELNSIVHLTAQQGTAVESLRAQLAEANDRINKLSAEVHDRKSVYRLNQLEELRNIQEQTRAERHRLEREQDRHRSWLEQEQKEIDMNKNDLEKQENDIHAQKEEVKRQREALQRQIDMYQDKVAKTKDITLLQTDTADGSQESEAQIRRGSSPKLVPIVPTHKRSASADFYQNVQDDTEKSQDDGSNPSNPPHRMESRPSAPNIHYTSNSNKQNLPVHLFSATNEKKSGVKVTQKLPTKLISGGGNSQSAIQQVLPFKLSSTSSASTSGGAASSNSDSPHRQSGGSSTSNSNGHNVADVSARNSAGQVLPGGGPSGLTNASHSTGSLQRYSHQMNSRQSAASGGPTTTSASNLSLVMKLAEPGVQKSRTNSNPNIVPSNSPTPTNQMQPKETPEKTDDQATKPTIIHKAQKSDSGVIYF